MFINQSLIVDSYQNQKLSQIYLCRCIHPLSFILWKYKRPRVFPACQLLFRGWRFCWGEECWAFFGQSPLFNFFKKTFVLSITHITRLQVPSRYNVTPQVHLEQLFQRQRAHQQEQQGRDSRAQRKVKYLEFSLSTATSLFPLPRKKLLLLRPPAATYPSAASSGRRNSISVSANSNLASMSNNTSSSMVATSSSTTRRRHVSMSSAASYGTPAASRGLPFYWT